jgi:hypothetical protein
MRKIGGTLAAGCSIILKPSEETPGTAIEIAEAFHVNGFTDAVKDHSGIKIIDSQLAYFSQEKAQTLMEKLYCALWQQDRWRLLGRLRRGRRRA